MLAKLAGDSAISTSRITDHVSSPECKWGAEATVKFAIFPITSLTTIPELRFCQLDGLEDWPVGRTDICAAAALPAIPKPHLL